MQLAALGGHRRLPTCAESAFRPGVGALPDTPRRWANVGFLHCSSRALELYRPLIRQNT